VIARKRARDVGLGRVPTIAIDSTGDPKSALAPAGTPKDDSAMHKSKTFTDEIRYAVLEAKKRGLLRSMIARAIGVGQSNIFEFVHGESGISSAALDRLAPILGLRLSVDVARQRRVAKKFQKAKRRA